MTNAISELIEEYKDKLSEIDININIEKERVVINQRAVYKLQGMQEAYQEFINDLQELREELR